ncbi:MAG: hypothetical protein HFJ51_05955 [Clostridia bacterium]|nr:hypothetical protein [Clostridia bacterium]
MEGNKKGENDDKVKIYDKDMYISQEKLRTIAIIIVIFVIGFITGYFTSNILNSEDLQIINEGNSSYSENKN